MTEKEKEEVYKKLKQASYALDCLRAKNHNLELDNKRLKEEIKRLENEIIELKRKQRTRTKQNENNES